MHVCKYWCLTACKASVCAYLSYPKNISFAGYDRSLALFEEKTHILQVDDLVYVGFVSIVFRFLNWG